MVKGQSILGTEHFIQRFVDYIKGHEAIPEIPKPQRYLTRHSLGQLISGRVLKDLRKRNEMVEEAWGNTVIPKRGCRSSRRDKR